MSYGAAHTLPSGLPYSCRATCPPRLPAGLIAKHLDLKRARYQKTAAYGHFGRDDPDFTWETVKKME